MLYTLNEGIHGNMGGMGRAGLYSRALSGTKHLIHASGGSIVGSIVCSHTDAELRELMEPQNFLDNMSELSRRP